MKTISRKRCAWGPCTTASRLPTSLRAYTRGGPPTSRRCSGGTTRGAVGAALAPRGFRGLEWCAFAIRQPLYLIPRTRRSSCERRRSAASSCATLLSEAEATFCPMPNKAARRRNREQRRLRAHESLAPDPGYVACAAADLASIDGQLDDACEALRELAGAAAHARDGWPATAETDELRAVLE